MQSFCYNPDMQKVVLVTGATSGIGKEIAKLFLQKGYTLILSGRNEEGFEEFRSNSAVEIVSGDITDKQTILQLVKAVEKHKRLDILVNNAGISFIQPFEDTTEEEVTQILETNVKAPILLTQALYPLMKSQKSGTVLFMNSAAGKQGYPNHTLYSTTKFALSGFAQSLRIEAKKDGIRVISIHPGGVKTALYDNVKYKPNIDDYMEPEKVAEVVVFLAETEGISPDELSISRMTK